MLRGKTHKVNPELLIKVNPELLIKVKPAKHSQSRFNTRIIESKTTRLDMGINRMHISKLVRHNE